MIKMMIKMMMMIRSIEGLEEVEMIKPGYTVEYNYSK